MYKIIYLFIICFLSVQLYAQNVIKIDGSITYLEASDTTHHKKLFSDTYLIIKEGPEDYYVGIRSNNSTIANVYIFDGNETINILHSSFSLGSTKYKKGKLWQPLDSTFFWGFRDPIISNPKSTANITEEFQKYYQENQWTANTAAQGSYRDMEFLISKKMLTPASKIMVAYKIVIDGKAQLHYWPRSIKQYTQSKELDERIYNGYLPRDISFNFQKFGSLILQ